jgi:hypothetical protein
LKRSYGVEITFHKHKLDEAVNQGLIFNYESEVFVTGAARNRISLRTFRSAQQYVLVHNLFGGPLITVTSRTDSVWTMLPDGEAMLVEASDNQSCSGGAGCNGGPYLAAVWHAAFHRVSDPIDTISLPAVVAAPQALAPQTSAAAPQNPAQLPTSAAPPTSAKQRNLEQGDDWERQ